MPFLYGTVIISCILGNPAVTHSDGRITQDRMAFAEGMARLEFTTSTRTDSLRGGSIYCCVWNTAGSASIDADVVMMRPLQVSRNGASACACRLWNASYMLLHEIRFFGENDLSIKGKKIIP